MNDQYFAYLAQLSYFFTLIAFSLRNISWIRGAAIAASLATIFYSAYVPGGPLWLPLAWHSLILLVNIFHYFYGFWRMRAVALTPLETFLNKTILTNFPPAEVKSFTCIAEEFQLPAQEQLIQQGTNIEYLYCILKGTVHVLIREQKVAELTAGHFVGEMSLLTRSQTRADVNAATDLRLLGWNHTAIENWVSSDPRRLTLLQTALGIQVVEQLLGEGAKGSTEEKVG